MTQLITQIKKGWNSDAAMAYLDTQPKNLKINEPDGFGNTPLILACNRNYTDLALRLIDLKADVHAKNVHEINAIYWAVENSDITLTERLLEKKVNLFFANPKPQSKLTQGAMGLALKKYTSLYRDEYMDASEAMIRYLLTHAATPEKAAFFLQDIQNNVSKNDAHYHHIERIDCFVDFVLSELQTLLINFEKKQLDNHMDHQAQHLVKSGASPGISPIPKTTLKI